MAKQANGQGDEQEEFVGPTVPGGELLRCTYFEDGASDTDSWQIGCSSAHLSGTYPDSAL
jgi:hypothetical protein